jgi:hypothetical protein
MLFIITNLQLDEAATRRIRKPTPHDLSFNFAISPLTSEGMILKHLVRISQHEFSHPRAL